MVGFGRSGRRVEESAYEYFRWLLTNHQRRRWASGFGARADCARRLPPPIDSRVGDGYQRESRDEPVPRGAVVDQREFDQFDFRRVLCGAQRWEEPRAPVGLYP